MFSESDFEKLKAKALKEAEEIADEKIKKAEEKLLKQKESFFKSLDIEKEKELLKLKYEKILKEKQTEIYKKHQKELAVFYEKLTSSLKKELLELIRKNGAELCRCFIDKIKPHKKGELFLPEYLKGKCKSEFKTEYVKNDCFVFKTGNKHIVFDPEETAEKLIKGLICLK
ncbi:hypothetical protein [Nautilia sp.]